MAFQTCWVAHIPQTYNYLLRLYLVTENYYRANKAVHHVRMVQKWHLSIISHSLQGHREHSARSYFITANSGGQS